MTKGYIVYADSGPMELAQNPEARGYVLYFASTATLFDTRPQARKAIQWTLGERPTFEQEFGRLRIKRVISVPERA